MLTKMLRRYLSFQSGYKTAYNPLLAAHNKLSLLGKGLQPNVDLNMHLHLIPPTKQTSRNSLMHHYVHILKDVINITVCWQLFTKLFLFLSVFRHSYKYMSIWQGFVLDCNFVFPFSWRITLDKSWHHIKVLNSCGGGQKLFKKETSSSIEVIQTKYILRCKDQGQSYFSCKQADKQAVGELCTHNKTNKKSYCCFPWQEKMWHISTTFMIEITHGTKSLSYPVQHCTVKLCLA